MIESGMNIPAVGRHGLGDDGIARRGWLDLVAVGAAWKQGALGRTLGCGRAKMDVSLVRVKHVPFQIGPLTDALADTDHVLIDESRDLRGIRQPLFLRGVGGILRRQGQEKVPHRIGLGAARGVRYLEIGERGINLQGMTGLTVPLEADGLHIGPSVIGLVTIGAIQFVPIHLRNGSREMNFMVKLQRVWIH